MARLEFEVQQYMVAVGQSLASSWVGPGAEVRASITCQSEEGYRLLIFFLAEGNVAPAPVYDPAREAGAMYLPVTHFIAYTDLIRNERPLFAHLDSEDPGEIYLFTAPEPVGEEERR
jgi:hypothetical protein